MTAHSSLLALLVPTTVDVHDDDHNDSAHQPGPA